MSAFDAYLKYRIIQALRKVYFQMNARKEVMERNRRSTPRFNKDGSRSKRDKVERQCEYCGDWVMTKDFQVDHVEPVVRCDWQSKDIGTPGFTWDTYIDRLFCGAENLLGTCTTCHDKKTGLEKHLRKQWRAFRAGKIDEPELKFLGKDFDNYHVIDGLLRRKHED